MAIGRANVGLAFRLFRAWRPDQVEQTLPFDLIQIGLMFLCAVADGRDFLHRRLAPLGWTAAVAALSRTAQLRAADLAIMSWLLPALISPYQPLGGVT